ncbi:MAG: hypothetical protein P4L72_05245 [Parvibaculum sp.]|uniref:hypothetical protein n=1 Tax=Parvibaculum sp. TaxID=2024848 RepID=UPI00284D227F|nr:hypothetical protein [Parvibaculum sp.]MDR3498617.1 hypothetical protein [Parvibaculum sp.]
MNTLKRMFFVGAAGFALLSAPAYAGLLGGSVGGGGDVGIGANVGIHTGGTGKVSTPGGSANASADTSADATTPDVAGTVKNTGAAAKDAGQRIANKAKTTGEGVANQAKDAGSSASGSADVGIDAKAGAAAE